VTTIASILNRSVAFTTRETTVAAAADLMRHGHVGSLVVVEEAAGKRGSGRGDDLFNVNLRASKRFNTGKGTTFELYLDVFNLFNRLNYGFYVDHMVDALAALFLLLGLAGSTLITPAVAIALLVAYFFLTINMGYATHALGVFKISFGAVGGTEMRILLALVNLAVLRWPYVNLAGERVLLFDVVGVVATIAVAVTALRSTAQVAKRLYDLERL